MTESEDELDDRPLITRQPSQRAVMREGSCKSFVSLMKTSTTNNESIKSQHEKILRVPFLHACMFATALEDVLTQIRILGECNNKLRIYKMNKELDVLRAAKFGIAQTKIVDDLANINPNNLQSEHHKLNKLADDRKFCMNVLTATYLELALKCTYRPLVDARATVYDRFQHYEFLIEDEARNRANSRELKKQLRQQRNRARTVIYDTNLATEKLRNDVEDATLNKEVRSRYIDKWELAREEQNAKRIENVETGPSDAIAYYRRKLESEQRVHYEQELHTNILINDVLRQLDFWVDKYDDDTGRLDLDIQIRKMDATNQMEKRMELEETLARHDMEMKKWNQFKEDRERARQYHKAMTDAAHTVQSWWRGLLVRQQIGPYKPQKKSAFKRKPEKKKE